MDPGEIPIKIDIEREISSSELDSRLRDVRLKGFPGVKIYESADIEIKVVRRDELKQNIFTPQPSIYRTFLEKVNKLNEMFRKKGIDMFRLGGGYDYTATYANGENCNWTLIPPVVEVLPIFFNADGKLDYSKLIGKELKEAMEREGHELNPELEKLDFVEFQRFGQHPGIQAIPEICDGSHRIHAALEQRIFQNLLFINHAHVEYPYYAAPKPYSAIHVEEDRKKGGDDKTHVLTEPGHKLLYRLFPSGGIHNGDVRPGE